ncbi:MAG: alpha/beta fold hydrolase [Kiritimatiellae bacterium]|nr:alpha/beta fold hydrolase [Kiritimatiellia bacterium]MDW8458351.1 alpha/beta fold hydrolase [Verrucomicrobiota bacterium]
MLTRAFLFSGWAFPESSLEPIVRAAGLELEMIDPGRADLWIGWSLGAIRALEKAADKPLILISASARFCGDGDWPGLSIARVRALRRLLSQNPEDALSRFHQLTSPHAAPETIATRVRSSIAIGIDPLLNGLMELERIDARARLPTCRVPALFLHGTRDAVIPADAGRRTAALMPNARFLEHPHGDHDLPLSDPEWLVGRIRDYLATLEFGHKSPTSI